VREETSDGSDFWLLNMATAKKRESQKRDTYKIHFKRQYIIALNPIWIKYALVIERSKLQRITQS